MKLLELPPPIYYSFTDPFIQEYYKYSLDEIEYFLKISVLLSSHVEITAANLWQSPLAMELFNSAIILFDSADPIYEDTATLSLVRLATREYSTNNKVFSTYFNQRLEEREHFIALPGLLTYLDFQLPDTNKIALCLDHIVKPSARSGGNVTELFTQQASKYFFNDKKGFIYNKLESHRRTNSVSRATIADCILSSPFASNRQEKLILDSNEIYFKSNAAATQAQLIYPQKKYKIVIYKPSSCQDSEYNFDSGEKVTSILDSINLNFNTIKSISFKSLYHAHKCGVLDGIKKYIWFMRANERVGSNFSNVTNSFFRSLCRRSVNLLLKINKECWTTSNVEFERYGLDLSTGDITQSKVFHFNLNRTLYFGGIKKMKEHNIPISTLIEECNSKLNFDVLKNIAVELFDDYEFISHSNKLEFVRELSLECKRRGKVEEFIGRCMKYNANFNILPLKVIMPTTITDWRGTDGSGENISAENQEKIIGDRHRFQSIAFLEKGFEVSKRICMMVNNYEQGFRATGFLVNKDYILTNQHVLSSKEVADRTEVWFNYEEGTSRQANLLKCKLFGQEAMISEQYDIALCRINYDQEPHFFESFPKVQFGMPLKDDTVPIIQHPNGMPKQICIGHNSLCYMDDERIQYLTDTMPGSSGAPVFDSNWNLIGLHCSGGWIAEPRSGQSVFRNQGIHINIIKEFLKSNNIVLI